MYVPEDVLKNLNNEDIQYVDLIKSKTEVRYYFTIANIPVSYTVFLGGTKGMMITREIGDEFTLWQDSRVKQVEEYIKSAYVELIEKDPALRLRYATGDYTIKSW